MFLKPGCKEEYKRRHANLFPELKRLLSESGVRNYSIYLDEDTNWRPTLTTALCPFLYQRCST